MTLYWFVKFTYKISRLFFQFGKKGTSLHALKIETRTDDSTGLLVAPFAFLCVTIFKFNTAAAVKHWCSASTLHQQAKS